MSLSIDPQPRISQNPVMSQEMQRSLKLLELPKPDFIQQINLELEENPALEIIEESNTEDPINDIMGLKCELVSAESPSEEGSERYEDEALDPDASNPLKKSSTDRLPQDQAEPLPDFLLRQLGECKLEPEEMLIGTLIADSLDEDGFLKRSIEDIAEMCSCSDNLEKAEKVLARMQSFDPSGVCARDLKECLLIQVKHRKIKNPIIPRIIIHHLEELKRKDYKAIARALKETPEEVSSAAKIISQLEPKPGRMYCEHNPKYTDPDLFVYKFENQFEIRLNDDGMPKLKLNTLYKKNGDNRNHLSEEDKEFIQKKKRSAEFLIGCVLKRQKTLRRVMESILKFQKDFFEQGTEGLRPLQMKTVADDIGLSESTVARATKNKYVSTPMGIFSLRDFFKDAIEQACGQSVASPVVQEWIKKIISEENQQKPYSDAKIEKRLKAAGFDIPRRTIAKYREKMAILPSSLRKRL